LTNKREWIVANIEKHWVEILFGVFLVGSGMILISSFYDHVLARTSAIIAVFLGTLFVVGGTLKPKKKSTSKEEAQVTPSVQAANPNVIEALLWQLRECWADIRQYDTLVWQIPSVSTIINGALLAFSSSSNLIIKIVTLGFALCTTFVLTIALAKHQFFRIYRFNEMEKLQKRLREYRVEIMVDGAKSTASVFRALEEGSLKDIPTGWLYRRTAYTWIRYYMFAMIGILSLLLIYIVSSVISL